MRGGAIPKRDDGYELGELGDAKTLDLCEQMVTEGLEEGYRFWQEVERWCTFV
jgi:hypothetical protein